MLPHLSNPTPTAKLHTAHGPLPHYIDPRQLPTKRKPFSTLWTLKYCHTVNVLVPASHVDSFRKELGKRWASATKQSKDGDGSGSVEGEVKYAKVMMKLADLVEPACLDAFVKKGDVLMLSEGRPGVDEVFALCDGILTLELDKATYERAGLVGKPIPDGGRKHTKSRYLIQINLRLPSMLHGKKGFERIVWAFKNVLTQSKTWLFYDCSSGKEEDEGGALNALAKYHTLWHTAHPTTHALPSTQIPRLPPPSASSPSTPQIQSHSPYTTNTDYSAALHEYLSLLSLGSPRVSASDKVDPYICRYEIPHYSDYTELPLLDDGENNGEEEDEGSVRVMDLVRLRWTGFLPASFAVQIVGALRSVLRSSERQSNRAGNLGGKTYGRASGAVDRAECGGEDDSMDVEADAAPDSSNAWRDRDAEAEAEDEDRKAQSLIDPWAMLSAHGFRKDHVTVFIPPPSSSSSSSSSSSASAPPADPNTGNDADTDNNTGPQATNSAQTGHSQSEEANDNTDEIMHSTTDTAATKAEAKAKSGSINDKDGKRQRSKVAAETVVAEFVEWSWQARPGAL